MTKHVPSRSTIVTHPGDTKPPDPYPAIAWVLGSSHETGYIHYVQDLPLVLSDEGDPLRVGDFAYYAPGTAVAIPSNQQQFVAFKAMQTFFLENQTDLTKELNDLITADTTTYLIISLPDLSDVTKRAVTHSVQTDEEIDTEVFQFVFYIHASGVTTERSPWGQEAMTIYNQMTRMSEIILEYDFGNTMYTSGSVPEQPALAISKASYSTSSSDVSKLLLNAAFGIDGIDKSVTISVQDDGSNQEYLLYEFVPTGSTMEVIAQDIADEISANSNFTGTWAKGSQFYYINIQGTSAGKVTDTQCHFVQDDVLDVNLVRGVFGVGAAGAPGFEFAEISFNGLPWQDVGIQSILIEIEFDGIGRNNETYLITSEDEPYSSQYAVNFAAALEAADQGGYKLISENGASGQAGHMWICGDASKDTGEVVSVRVA